MPAPEALAAAAAEINRVLREAGVRDGSRPAYVGAAVLALWQARGALRTDDPDALLAAVNAACAEAFAAAGRRELARSLAIEEADGRLAGAMGRVVGLLEQLGVTSSSCSRDYLGELYEACFRYTGGNTIGQYFTPRHVARMMADLCEVAPTDTVIDPACGTGGFLVAALQRVREQVASRPGEAAAFVRDHLVGYEDEPATAALCVANMILRGDGRSAVRRGDVFAAADFPLGACDVALTNPPFPHRSTDVPPQRFVERALEALRTGGRLAAVLPTSLLVKRSAGAWRARILDGNALVGVVQLPDELFRPYASATTSVVVLRKGVPHGRARATTFVRVRRDGYTLRKGTRVEDGEHSSQLGAAVAAVRERATVPGFAGTGSVRGTDEWAAGAYIPSAPPAAGELHTSIDELLRRLASFYVRYAKEVADQRAAVAAGAITVTGYRDLLSPRRVANARGLGRDDGTIGRHLDIFYGQKELHSRAGIPAGRTLVISPTEEHNGCYGWLEFPRALAPPFVTVAQTGNIGEAFVQLEACAVNDDCLVLLPVEEGPGTLARLVVAAAAIRLERWRFNYGRKLTPARIAAFAYPGAAGLEGWVTERVQEWQALAETAVARYAGPRAP